ncbi:uncharacterized protein EAF02_009360 [Botrytis sinoallii]|uniref:uncharacterized protein n=1 Tax=Botrytis sinoallii TaxID=1463999 RepID=UPI00190247FF|nr:uncharacterized protein EAF02_009360 [Botrytis sinoallii]KAF7870170.1 hypothetical protein EAF02_009360 [Botrytis sinoallii]
MPKKSKPPNPGLPKQRSLRSNVNIHAVYCMHCDAEYEILVPKCPNCALPQYESSIRPRRPANYYDDDFDDGATFTCFMKLPLEIRVMIWQASLPGPRVVLLRPTWVIGLHEVSDAPDFIFESSSPITALYVCRESFNVASTRYTQAFDSLESPFTTWFNFDIDTLYIGHSETFYRGLPGVENLKHLAVFANPLPAIALDKNYDTEVWWDSQDSEVLEVFLDDYLVDAGSLEELKLVTRRYPFNAHAYAPDRYDDLSFIDLQDIDASLNFYKSPYEPKLEESFQSTQQEYAAQLRSLASIKFDALDEYRNTNHKAPKYEMPVIRNMIVTTTSMKAKLERAKVAFEVKKADYMKSNKLLAI